MTRLLALLLSALALAFAPAPALAEPAPLVGQLERLSAGGNAEASYHLGMIHHLGVEGVPQDAKRAFRYFLKAAEGGDPLGAYKVGCFYDGQGGDAVQPDAAKALRYKLIAAEAGYELAQLDVAGLYAGREELDSALRWLEAAARQGSLQALGALTALHAKDGPRPDPVRASMYLVLIRRLFTAQMEEVRRERPEVFQGGAPSPQDLLKELDRMLPVEATVDQQREGAALAADWQTGRTALTEKAGSGLDAARRLVAANPS